MGFGCRSERLLDAYMKLPRAYPEPTTATGTQGFRLFDFRQPKNVTKEVACLRLASFRGRDLQMVNIGYQCSRRDGRSLPTVRSPHLVGCFYHRDYALELLCDFLSKRKHVFNLEAFLRIRANESTQRSLNVSRYLDQAANVVNCVAILEQSKQALCFKRRGHRVPKVRFSCHADVNSLSEWGLFDERHCSSKFEFFAVIANEEKLRLVVLGDVVPPLKKCK
jgi:hypothetical protein